MKPIALAMQLPNGGKLAILYLPPVKVRELERPTIETQGEAVPESLELKTA